MIDTLVLLRFANTILPLFSIPATLYMFWVVFNERRLVRSEAKFTSVLLSILFLLAAISAIVNVVQFGWLLTDHPVSNELHNARVLLTNSIMFIGSWGFILVRNGTHKE